MMLLTCSNLSAQTRVEYGPEFEFRSQGNALSESVCAGTFAALIGYITNQMGSGSSEGKDYEVWTDYLYDSGKDIIQWGFTGIAALRIGIACGSLFSSLKAGSLAEHIRKNCQGCSFSEVKHPQRRRRNPSIAYRFTYPGGWYFQVNSDFTAVEIQMSPLDSEEIERVKTILQRDLFEAAKGLGLKPPTFDLVSGGHINISFDKAFKDNPRLLRNFMVDQFNHSELATGVFLNDPFNARSPMNSSRKRKMLASIIERFDRGEITTSTELSREFMRVIGKNKGFIDLGTIIDPHIPEGTKRVEVRAHRAQKNADEYLKLTQLYDKRLAYLESLETDIAFIDKPPAILARRKIESFYRFVTESGADWNDYVRFLPERYQSIASRIADFLKSLECRVKIIDALKSPI